ncbi:hypothetical protein LTR84_007049 [Exophiala bonariae]|uniref:Transcription factor domain-containing protein n=1 Tax=Exophiala bonariae TaxID=1690606 RepID=A0AAV9MZI9_9EURO|nr:hypothetical protein LTR84_007049 [Exophiala bonariae]
MGLDPYLVAGREPTSDICTLPTKLFRELDACMADQLDDHADEISTAAARQEENDQIDQSLRRSMYSYAAQWLPLLGEQGNSLMVPYDQITRDCWRTTRREMLRIINRKSYRSVLALYLFSQTAIPTGLSEDEERDGISGVVCNQTAYLQIQQLRERLRNSNFDCSEASAWSDSISTPVPSPNISDSYLSLESRAFWAAITWDTCSSMTLNFRSSLSSGLKGACLETSWRLARGFLVGSFQSRTEVWRKQGFEVSDEIAQEITSAVAVCIIYTWRTIASVKEALREGVEEESVLFSWKAVLDALDIFRTTIHPLLNTIERQLHFLSQVNRLYWYEMIMHYYLGILMLVEALDIAKRTDLSSQVTDARLEAEHGCFNNLKFGLEGKYAVDTAITESQTNFDDTSPSGDSHQLIVTSFVAIDPYPHHVVASVRLAYNAVSRKYRQGNIKYEAFYHLSSTLLRVLAELPQSSKAVILARKNLQDSINRLETSSATVSTYIE